MKHNMHEQRVYDQLKEYIIHDGNMINLGQLLYFAAQRFGNNVALIHEKQTVLYQELFYRACLFSNELKKKGVKPRDRVLLFFENSIEFYIGYYGIAQCGAVVAPVNTFLKERELTHIINDAQPRLLVASTTLLEKLQQDNVAISIPILTQEDMDLTSSLDESLCNPIPAYLESDEMAALLYTSGTTGLPKGVMLSSKNILTNCMQTIARLGIVKDERVFGVLPFFHSFAQFTSVWAPFLLGCTVIIVRKVDRRYILEGLTHKPTMFMGVPALFGLMCLLQNVPVGSVKYFVTGGDAMPDKIRGGFELLYQRKIAAGYGLSETSPVLTADLEDVAEPTSNVGRPLLGVTISIRNEHGAPLPDGEIGQIWVQGANVMLGYYNEPAKTKEVFKEGWFDTGDLGYIGPRGKLVVTGRIKDLIAHKGFKIYPQEVENVLLMHPNVIQAAVIGKLDENVGEIPVAYVQIRMDESTMQKELYNLCERNLASYKIPRLFICSTAALPTTSTGKVDKKVLRIL